MYRVPAIMFILFFTCITVAQVPVNQTDGQGRKQGIWRKQGKDGKLIYVGQFINDIPVDTFRYYYPGGALKMISVHSMKGRRARTISYFKSGRKMAAGNYLDEKKDSTWQFFSESTLQLVSEENYLNGELHGVSRVFYPEGGISGMTHYDHGIKEGNWAQYYPDGMLKSDGTYHNGEKNGRFHEYWPSGIVQISGNYVDGHKDGLWTISDEKGKIIRRDTYKMGKLQIPATPPKK